MSRQIRIEEQSSCSQGKPKRDSEFRDRPGTEFLPAHWENKWIGFPGKAPESRYEYRMRYVVVPAKAIIESQPRKDFPGILGVQADGTSADSVSRLRILVVIVPEATNEVR